MFILRRITSEGLERNEILGADYSFINRETQYDEFKRSYKTIFDIDHVADLDDMSDDFSKNCYGIIVCNDGSRLVPLYKKSHYYIMTESGKTFNNISYR